MFHLLCSIGYVPSAVFHRLCYSGYVSKLCSWGLKTHWTSLMLYWTLKKINSRHRWHFISDNASGVWKFGHNLQAGGWLEEKAHLHSIHSPKPGADELQTVGEKRRWGWCPMSISITRWISTWEYWCWWEMKQASKREWDQTWWPAPAAALDKETIKAINVEYEYYHDYDDYHYHQDYVLWQGSRLHAMSWSLSVDSYSLRILSDSPQVRKSRQAKHTVTPMRPTCMARPHIGQAPPDETGTREGP